MTPTRQAPDLPAFRDALKVLRRYGARFRCNMRKFGGLLARAPRHPVTVADAGLSTARVAAFLLVVVTVFLAVDPVAVHWKWYLPPETLAAFYRVTDLGLSKWYIAPAVIVLLVLGFVDWSRLQRRSAAEVRFLLFSAGAVFVSVAGSGLAANIIKRMIGRARPRHFDELGPLAFDPFAFTNSFASFPSGHSTTAGAICVLLIVFLPRWRAVWLVLWPTVALSRVLVGAHYLSDTIAGFAFGAVVSLLVVHFLARRGLGFRPAPTVLLRVAPTRKIAWAALPSNLMAVVNALRDQPIRHLPQADNLSMKPENTSGAPAQSDGATTGSNDGTNNG